MSVKVELQGPNWSVYQDGDQVFSGDYRAVEEWLDHAEIASKYPESPAAIQPRTTQVGRLPSLIPMPNVPVTSAKP